MMPVIEPENEVKGMPFVPGVCASVPALLMMMRSPFLVTVSCVRCVVRCPGKASSR